MRLNFILPLLLLAASATAQVKNPIASALKDTFPARQKNTIAAVEEMPADKFSYKPSADQITFGHLVAHMVEANYTLCSNAAAVPAPKVDEAKDTDSKEKLVASLRHRSISAATRSARWTIRSWANSPRAMAASSCRAPALPWASPATGPTTTPRPPCICG